MTTTPGVSPFLKTDAYEYSMLSSLVGEGLADTPATFELFARKLPEGRRFGLLGGLGRVLDHLLEGSLSPGDLAYLREACVVTPAASAWLEARAARPFTGSLWSYPEGSAYHPYSPVVRVEGTLGEGLLLETLLLSILNHDSALASAGGRMKLAAGSRPMIEMGTRRTDDEAALAAARVAYVTGFASTSNLAAGQRYGIPVAGTAAHAYTLAHRSEEEAFLQQMKTWGTDTTLLVDTYDTLEGVRRAVAAARSLGAPGPGAVRVDSGDLLVVTHGVRALLDSLGATATRIVVSSDLDEYLMSELSPAPIDGYGVGTRFVTGSGHPTAGMVYKLVEVAGRPVEKRSSGKASVGGRKFPYLTEEGRDFYSLKPLPTEAAPAQELYVSQGEVVRKPSLQEVRAHCAATLEALPPEAKLLSAGEAWHSTTQREFTRASSTRSPHATTA